MVDAFDAITSDRPYRKGQPTEVAVEELKAFSGIQFDPHIVEVFFSILGEQEMPWIMPRRRAVSVAVPAQV
ncbi:MAG: hypothetical protein HY304_04865 [candidate division Zixibacteria bacterium]|nr:hypothetical protein [candidate division Zixibacteria bacterium]